MTAEKISRWEKEGRGTGEGTTYAPWLTVQDVPSSGLRIRTWSHLTKRVHHLLSFLEYLVFLYLLSRADVIDIKEQFPLPLVRTLAIAAAKGYQHPTDPSTRCPVVMTTDFVAIVRNCNSIRVEAHNTKPSAKLEEARVQQKVEIERAFWDEVSNSSFHIDTEKSIPVGLVANARWLRVAFRDYYLTGVADRVPQVERYLRNQLLAPQCPLVECTDSCDAEYSLESGTSLAITKWLLAHRLWIADLSVKIEPTHPLLVSTFRYAT